MRGGGGAGGRVTPEQGRCGRAGGQPQAEARPAGHGGSGPARLTSGPHPEGVLTLRARPPSEAEFVDCFQKTKLAFNLLVRARTARPAELTWGMGSRLSAVPPAPPPVCPLPSPTVCPLPSPRPSCGSTSRIPARLSWCTSSSDLWTWCLGLGEAGTWGLVGDWEKQVPTLGSWLGPASTVRAADTVGQPVVLPGVEGLGDGGRDGGGESGQQPPLTPAVPPRSSALVVAQTSLALCPGPCCPATLWGSCVATWSPRRWPCGNPWGRPGHAPGRAAPGWGPAVGGPGVLSGVGSASGRSSPQALPPQLRVAAGAAGTPLRAQVPQWLGATLGRAAGGPLGGGGAGSSRRPRGQSSCSPADPTSAPHPHCPPSWPSPCHTPNLGACFPTAGSSEPTVL